jgi:hypothetical protein
MPKHVSKYLIQKHTPIPHTRALHSLTGVCFHASLSGLGVARQRKAIVQGLQHSVADFANEVKGTTPKDVMDILLLSQYFDTLSVIGANNLFLEHEPSTVAKLQDSIGSSRK